MKFTIMCKDNQDVIDYANQHQLKRFGNGASLDGWCLLRIKDDNATAIGLHCSGSIFSYLWHKRKFGKMTTICRGWVGQK